MGAGHDQKERLAEVVDGAGGQEWLVMDRRRDIIGKGQIIRRQHSNHTGGAFHLCEVHRADHPPGNPGCAKGQM